MNADDERLARLVRLIRRRSQLSQRSLAALAGVPRDDVLRIEAGECGTVRVDRVRCVLEALGARGRLTAWYNGAAADALLDERHAALVERAARLLTLRKWLVLPEVSFNDYGDRGSIDLLAGHPRFRAIAVCEIKSEIGSLEETNRKLDVKERIAPTVAKARLGWWPTTVGRLLIVPEGMTIRRTIDRHLVTMDSAYPARGREVRAWLRSPSAPIRGIWFLSEVANRDRISM